MKVLMFGWEFPPHNSGGLGVACQGLARALKEKNTDVVFVLPKFLGNTSENFKIVYANVPDINILAVNSLLTPYISSEKYARLRRELGDAVFGNTLFEEVRRYGLIAKRIAASEPHDIIHAHDWLSFSAGMGAKSVSRRPFIAHVHATEVDRTAGNVNRYIYDRELEGVNASDRVISVSEYTKKTLINHYLQQPDKITVVHNGIDCTNYNTNVAQNLGLYRLKKLGFKIVLFVGRITIMKGPDYFVTAARHVLKERTKTMFVVVGSGDMEGQIMNQVAALGISDKFLFPGFLRGKQLSEIFKTADLFVMPSVSEPFGLTPLESLIHGTPVIVSKQSGVSEVLNHVFKVDFWDTEEMADKILSVLNYKSLQTTLKINGQKEANLITWDKAADKCLSVYNQLNH
jgi:glycosyltransferase involved in cell wall biosynthesis